VIENNKWFLSVTKFMGLCATLLCCTTVQASVVSFTNFQHVGSDAVDYIVTIEDDAEAGVTSGSFRISYEVAPSSPNTVGKLTGFFLDFGEPDDPPVTFTLADLGFGNESADDLSCGQAFNTDSINAGGGCNTQLQLGAGANEYQGHLFDIAIAWKSNDLSGFGVSSFEISNLGFSIADISAVALRGQDTSGLEGSAKDFAVAAVIPVPGAMLLFLSGIGGFVAVKRKAA